VSFVVHFRDMTAEERIKVLKEKTMIVKERKEGYSQWCTVLYRLSIANKVSYQVSKPFDHLCF
jgi:hypothetical protein